MTDQSNIFITSLSNICPGCLKSKNICKFTCEGVIWMWMEKTKILIKNQSVKLWTYGLGGCIASVIIHGDINDTQYVSFAHYPTINKTIEFIQSLNKPITRIIFKCPGEYIQDSNTKYYSLEPCVEIYQQLLQQLKLYNIDKNIIIWESYNMNQSHYDIYNSTFVINATLTEDHSILLNYTNNYGIINNLLI